MGKRKQRPTEPEAEAEAEPAAADVVEGEQEGDEQDDLTGGSSSDGGGSEDVGSGSSSDDSGSEGDEEDSDDSDSDDDGSSNSGPEVSDEEDGKEGSDDPDAFDKIDVNFEFFDPKESDFHGLKALLHSYLDGQQYDSSALIDAIIQQVGTVVRTGEDEDPIAVMTVLNTQQHSNSSGSTAAAGGGGKAGSSSSKKEGKEGEAGGGFMQQIKQHMLSHCKDAATKQQLNKVWEQPSTGLIINERLINSPPQLAPPLVQALFSEIAWATEDEPTQARRDAFKFKQYLLMTRVFSDPLPQQQQQQQGGAPAAAAAAAAAAAGGPSSSSKGGGKPPAGGGRLLPPKGPQQPAAKKQKQQHGGGAQANAPVIVYVRPEDEFFHKHATASFTFPIEGRAVGKDELQPLRLVMLLPANKVAAARTALDAVVGNMAAQQL